MPIIPTPDEARKLLAQFAGNPIIDEIEIQLRQRGITTAAAAAAALRELVGLFGVTERECQAGIARFMTPAELLDEPDVEDGWECTDCDCYHPCDGRVCPEQCACHRQCGCADYPGNEQ